MSPECFRMVLESLIQAALKQGWAPADVQRELAVVSMTLDPDEEEIPTTEKAPF